MSAASGKLPTAASPLARLRASLVQAAAAVRGEGVELGEATLARPPRVEFGDYSSNAAMLLAPALRSQPREVAERLGERLAQSLGAELERVEVAGPGFVNLFLSDAWFRAALQTVRDEGERFGAGGASPEDRERILIEFVSANPTGPLTAASGRHAAFGDSLARVLEFVGHDVEREYYINDHGTQIGLFGRSIAAAMTGSDPPPDGYPGAYVADLGAKLREEGVDPSDLELVTRRGVELLLEQVKSTLERFRVHFDHWTSEHELQNDNGVARVLDALETGGHVYSSEGATWLRTTSFGDDKDRVLRRSSGELTYFASDIAYHEAKRERGPDRLINVLGADHHGYISRIKAGWEAIGGSPERLEPIIMQLVHVVERGDRTQMSKRKGEFLSLDELIDDIGVDAARFFMLQRSHDTALDIDLDLARRESEENPVYYVQYAHARIASILRNAGDERLQQAQATDLTALDLVLEPSERALIKRLLELPEEIAEAAARRAPHRLTTYAREVAADFHAFYRDCRVVGATPSEREDLRLCLCLVSASVIARALALVGVSAPERM